MDLSKIKNLVKQNGDKFIFVENGEPEIVVMSFREYTKLAHSDSIGAGVPELYQTDRRSQQNRFENAYGESESEVVGEDIVETEFIPPFSAVPARARQGFGSSNLPVRLEDIRLEDLPI